MKYLLISFWILSSVTSHAQEILLQAQSQDLAYKVKSPEGITVSGTGVLYTSSMTTGKIFSSKAPFDKTTEIIDMSTVRGWESGKSKVLGILSESSKQLWVAISNLRGGCIFSIQRTSNHYIGKPALCNAGEVNALSLDQFKNYLFISSRLPKIGTEGMIIKVSLTQLKEAVQKNTPIMFNKEEHLLISADMPNGLALSPDGSELLFAETSKDSVSSVNLVTKKVTHIFETSESGWVDGLHYIKDRDLYVLTDSKLGKLHFFSLKGRKILSIRILDLNKQSTGLASIAIQGDRLFVTDLWEGSLYDMALSQITSSDTFLTYHNHVYQFSISELLNFK